MTKDEDFKLLKIQTCVLRVNIHCEGCKQKVKKLLHRIEGVYQVSIDEEQQKVTVLGSVDSANLIKRLVKGGKHAEPWSQKTNQTQKQKDVIIKDDGKGKRHTAMKGLESFKSKQKFPLIVEEDDEYVGTDDEDDDYEFDEQEMQQLFREKLNQLAMLNQQCEAAASSAKKGASNNAAIGNSSNVAAAGKKGNCNLNNAVVKPNPNPNPNPNSNPGGIDQKTLAALKMNVQNANNKSSSEGKMGNDINAVMSLAGFHGNGGGFPGNGFTATGQNHGGSMMMSMDGHQAQHYSHQMMMNNRQAMQQQQQPQLVSYNKSALIPPTTGYYYNYGHVLPCPDGFGGWGDHDPAAASHVFSDENATSCSIM